MLLNHTCAHVGQLWLPRIARAGRKLFQGCILTSTGPTKPARKRTAWIRMALCEFSRNRPWIISVGYKARDMNTPVNTLSVRALLAVVLKTVLFKNWLEGLGREGTAIPGVGRSLSLILHALKIPAVSLLPLSFSDIFPDSTRLMNDRKN